ncbi:MAG: endonuclease/exonuclease/phosphatase [Armatimonadetes bacterium]|nr:endonuclease/exonuclease/phosphatase [Armatimonadota bacterium]
MRRRDYAIVSAVSVAAILFAGCGWSQEPVDVVAWNLESGGASILYISDRMKSMPGVELWGLSEVKPGWEPLLELAAENAAGPGSDFEAVLGTTGEEDQLLILFDARRFSRQSVEELHQLNPKGRVRSPLLVTLLDTRTNQRFGFMVNHLYRTDDAQRHLQAWGLNQWARTHPDPLVAVGDYNFDWRVQNGEADHDAGYDLLTRDGVFAWIRPPTLVKTQNSRHDSVVDFAFCTQPERFSHTESGIVQVEGDFDWAYAAEAPDHRPITARVILKMEEPQ